MDDGDLAEFDSMINLSGRLLISHEPIKEVESQKAQNDILVAPFYQGVKEQMNASSWRANSPCTEIPCFSEQKQNKPKLWIYAVIG